MFNLYLLKVFSSICDKKSQFTLAESNGLVYKPHPRFLAQNLSKKMRLIHESLRYFLVLFLMHCISNIHITGRLSPISHDVTIDEPTYKWAETFLGKYIDALIANLENRFAKVPVVAAFSIFQMDELPEREDSSFHSYGKDNIKQLAEHFSVSLEIFSYPQSDCCNLFFCLT